MRLSNFRLWQVAYTEIYVTDILWRFSKTGLLDALPNSRSVTEGWKREGFLIGRMKKRITGVCVAPSLPCSSISAAVWFLALFSPFAVVALLEAASLAGCSMKDLLAVLVSPGWRPCISCSSSIHALDDGIRVHLIAIKVFDRNGVVRGREP